MTKLPRHQLASVVANLSLKDGSSDKRLVTTIAAYLLEEHRVGELDSLLRDVQQAWAVSGYVDVLAHVARPLPQAIYDELAKPFKAFYPQAKTINVTPIVNASVIGGANMELAEKRLDISIARRIRRFKKAINVKGS